MITDRRRSVGVNLLEAILHSALLVHKKYVDTFKSSHDAAIVRNDGTLQAESRDPFGLSASIR